MAQSKNPFGIPSADEPTPAASINAVPGSRAQGWRGQGRSEVLARHGMVATSDPLAAEAGLELLRDEQRIEHRPALHRQPRPEHQSAHIRDARLDRALLPALRRRTELGPERIGRLDRAATRLE